jgi:murein DD-endopeptidase MepM/ murein hydrolase activator NlpD
LALGLALFAAGVAASAIQAGAPLSITTTSETTPTTTAPTTTDVTTPATTTVATTTAATTTVATTTAAAPQAKLLGASPLARPRCLVVSGFALLEPGRQPLTLGTVAVVPRVKSASEGSVAYPADGSILSASSVAIRGSGCSTSARAHVTVGSLSLFGGAATVKNVALGVAKGVAGSAATVSGLTVGTSAVAATPGRAIVIAPWAYVVALAKPDRTQAGALAVHLTKAHSGLPAGTVLLIGFAQLAPVKEKAPVAKPPAANAPAAKAPAAKTHVAKPPAVQKAKPATLPKLHEPQKQKKKPKQKPKRKFRLGDRPLELTPHLGLTGYAFPVAGVTSYGDSYGGFRGDVPGNWHHGDDIFAPLGTPVVAVADGTLNRVGWEHLGGWRLWVRDHKRNEFYYAHLSGYSPKALRSKFVKKGEVIGFVGNTGDAFTTPPHLHFEIHPHQLLRLDYNGAVDPTTYIQSWSHVTKAHLPAPAHPPFPGGEVRKEATYIWRQLLAARGLTPKAPKASERPRIHVAAGDHGPATPSVFPREASAAGLGARHASGMTLTDLLAGIVLPALLFGAGLAFRLRRGLP